MANVPSYYESCVKYYRHLIQTNGELYGREMVLRSMGTGNFLEIPKYDDTPGDSAHVHSTEQTHERDTQV